MVARRHNKSRTFILRRSYVKKLPKLDDTSAQDGPYGIVLAPSRELVIQIEEERHTVLNQCTYVVIDEADKMVDLGFEDYVRRVLLAIPASLCQSEEGSGRAVQVLRQQWLPRLLHPRRQEPGMD
eukprot:g19332.t1